MREIFLALLVINFLALAGQLLWPADTGAAAEPSGTELADGDLELLSERGSRGSRAEEPAPAEAGVGSGQEQAGDRPAPGESRFCILVGPFERLLRAEQFSEHLESLEIRSQVRELEVPAETRHWVYLPPLASREEALTQLRALQSEGLDSYLIPEGELSNGISLGVFSRRDLAETRLQDMRERGYGAELEEIVRYRAENWVVMELAEADKVDSALWVELLNRAPGAEKQQKFCPGVASATNFL